MNYSVFLWYNNTDGIIGHERIGKSSLLSSGWQSGKTDNGRMAELVYVTREYTTLPFTGLEIQWFV